MFGYKIKTKLTQETSIKLIGFIMGLTAICSVLLIQLVSIINGYSLYIVTNMYNEFLIEFLIMILGLICIITGFYIDFIKNRGIKI